jgi:hypothetical protein
LPGSPPLAPRAIPPPPGPLSAAANSVSGSFASAAAAPTSGATPADAAGQPPGHGPKGMAEALAAAGYGSKDTGAPGAAATAKGPTLRAARWGALVMLLSVGAILWFAHLLVRDAEAAEFAQVDPRASRVDFGPGFSDPRWEAIVATRLAQLPPLHPENAEELKQVEAALYQLPFIERIEDARVLWPDGLRVKVHLRQPVACVRAGDMYLVVSADAVILPGPWSAPPQVGSGFLPLVAIEDTVKSEIWEGNVLDSVGGLDGVAVAIALQRELAPDDWARLGRIVIDARDARNASVEVPGTVLHLELGRRIWFGRSPNAPSPGELPYQMKCASIAKALRAPENPDAPVDWELADVRWDVPELLPRGGLPKPEKRPNSPR